MQVSDLKRWSFGSGHWLFQDGILRPAERGISWGTIGDPAWQDYTVNLKDRKVGGDEGFLILWHAADADTYNWWNVGGWGNTATRAESAHDGTRVAYGGIRIQHSGRQLVRAAR